MEKLMTDEDAKNINKNIYTDQEFNEVISIYFTIIITK